MFTSKITESTMELTKVEKVKMKDITDTIKIEDAVNEEGFIIIEPKGYVIVEVSNDKVENGTPIENLVIIDKEGLRYRTGSASFKNSFMDIWSELGGEDGWNLKVFGKESKNYTGKKFLTCCVA